MLLPNNLTQRKTPEGNFFENFQLGQTFKHGVPRTITQGDVALYTALTNSRFALYCAEPIAKNSGFKDLPVDNFLVFHLAFGKTVNDISLNAVANLGYAEVKFHQPSYCGDTLSVSSEVIGLKENSSGKNGVVYVRSKAYNQHNQLVVSWIRWVMIEKKVPREVKTQPIIPNYSTSINNPETLIPNTLNFSQWDYSVSDNQYQFYDLNINDVINHRDGLTINESDHSLATRLYQNNARVHFDQHFMENTKSSKRLVYGGHIISLCRSLSYTGLANAQWLCGINGGSHTNPSYAGDTIYSQSYIIDKKVVNDRDDLGLIRLRTIGVKNSSIKDMPFIIKNENNRFKYHSNVVLDLDYWVAMIA